MIKHLRMDIWIRLRMDIHLHRFSWCFRISLFPPDTQLRASSYIGWIRSFHDVTTAAHRCTEKKGAPTSQAPVRGKRFRGFHRANAPSWVRKFGMVICLAQRLTLPRISVLGQIIIRNLYNLINVRIIPFLVLGKRGSWTFWRELTNEHGEHMWKLLEVTNQKPCSTFLYLFIFSAWLRYCMHIPSSTQTWQWKIQRW